MDRAEDGEIELEEVVVVGNRAEDEAERVVVVVRSTMPAVVRGRRSNQPVASAGITLPDSAVVGGEGRVPGLGADRTRDLGGKVLDVNELRVLGVAP